MLVSTATDASKNGDSISCFEICNVIWNWNQPPATKLDAEPVFLPGPRRRRGEGQSWLRLV